MSVNITIISHLWIIWARLAIDGAGRAALARRQYHLAVNSPPSTVTASEALGTEAAESMASICATVFALEAMVSAVGRLVMLPCTINKWESPGQAPKTVNRVREVLKNAIVQQKLASTLATQWETVILDRNAAVHFLESPGSPEPHPVGTNVAPENARYTLETAKGAVGLLFDTLHGGRDHPKPDAAGWSTDFGPAIVELGHRWTSTDMSATP